MKSSAKRNYIFYVLMLLIFGVLFWMVIRQGKLWDAASDTASVTATEQTLTSTVAPSGETGITKPYELFTQSLQEGLHHPLAVLLLQIISILVAVGTKVFSICRPSRGPTSLI